MFELRVLSGQHQGAALPLVGEQWTIGSAEQQDLALDDPGIAELHGQLQRQGQRWVVNAAEGELHDEQGQSLQTVELQPNAAFMLGSVWLCVSPASDNWPSLPALVTPEPSPAPSSQASAPLEKLESRPKRLFSHSSGIIIGVLIGIIGSAWSLPHSAALLQGNSQAAALPGNTALSSATQPDKVATPPAPATGRTRLVDGEAVRHQLHNMLSERLLSDISIEQTPQGLILNGELKDEALLVYQRMLERFKNSYESPVTVLDNVNSSDASLPFVVVQIMSGPHAHLVTADGRRMYLGDELDGLRLTHIDDKHLQFDGARHVEVNW